MTSSLDPEAWANLDRARRSLEAARKLLDEGFPDFAASRAYYGAFYAASAVLQAEGIEFKKHGGAITAVHQHLIKTGRLDVSFGKDLRYLYEMRLVGDYGESRHVPEDEAREVIEIAARVVNALSEMISGNQSR